MAYFKLLIPLFLTLAILHHLQPAMGAKVCEKVECGKGKCVASKHSSVGFVCKCHAGWLQSPTGDTDGNDFFACVYPNCTIDSFCVTSRHPRIPEPVQSPPVGPGHIQDLDPCEWVFCEKGTCKRKSAFRWSCNCVNGFHNLNHNSSFPCFAPCEIGKDCAKFGATI